jgi:hypothetical protein
LFNVPIDWALDTPPPPVAAPQALESARPVIVPLLLIVVAGQPVTSTPSESVTPAEPGTIPVVVMVMAPPLLRTGLVLDVEMVWGDPEPAARARSGAAKAPGPTSEAPVSSEARAVRVQSLNVGMLERPSAWQARARLRLFFTPTTRLLPKSKRFFTYRFY